MIPKPADYRWLASLRHCLMLAAFALPGQAVMAEVFIYRGANGERLVSDRPMPGYTLMSRQDSVRHAGHILANRPVATGGRTDFRAYIRMASERHGVDPVLVQAVIQVESGFDPNAESVAGAQGLMQLMPATARQYRVSDRRNPRENINAGVRHLSSLMQEFDGDISMVLAAYNAGAGAVKKYNGVPPYPETERYVEKVLNLHDELGGLWYNNP